MGTADGKVHLVDIVRNKILKTIQLSSPEITVFSVDWNTDGYLAIASTESNVFIKRFDPENKNFDDVTQLGTNQASRIVTWNPSKQNILAVGLFNGQIVVFNTE